MQFLSNYTGENEEMEMTIETYVEHYYDQIQKVKTLRGKISAIAELLRALEVAHFFPDGNQRTYAFLLMNKLLIENNIPPAILEEPGMFDAWCTVGTLANEIYKGITNFLKNDLNRQSQFLHKQCKSLQFNDKYFVLNDYSRFFVKGFGKEAENSITKILRTDIKRSILNGNLKELNESLNKAIILADPKLVGILLKMGAKPYCKEDYRKSPFLVSLRHFNPDIAKKLLSFIDLKSVDRRFVGVVQRLLQSNIKYGNYSEIKEYLNEILAMFSK